MEKIVMEDGSEREVPTAEELADLTAKAQELENIKAEYEKTKAELAQAENPNWKALRTQADQMRAKLAEKGVQFDQSGNPLPDNTVPQITPEQITNTAKEAAKGFFIEDAVQKSISKLDKDSQAIVKRHYDKLVSGETVDASNVGSYVEMAMRAAGVSSESQRSVSMPSYGGGEPKPLSQSQEDLKKGVELANAFGYKPKTDLNKLVK